MADGGTPPAASEVEPAVEPDLTLLASGLARFFVSLELAHDASQLTRLGNGRLWLDLRQRRARHGHQWVPFLRIGETLRHRLSNALQAREQSLEGLRLAELEADLTLRTVARHEVRVPGGGGWCGDDGPLILAEMTVTVRLASATRQWQGRHQGTTDWPETWGRKP